MLMSSWSYATVGEEAKGEEESSNKNWHDQPMLLRHIGNIALKCEASEINNLQIPKKKERQQHRGLERRKKHNKN